MARLLGLLGHRSEDLAPSLEAWAPVLDVAAGAALRGVGLGLHQAGEVLIRRRPQPLRGPLSLAPWVTEAQADALLLHLDPLGASQGPAASQPLRARQWLFALDGELAQLAPWGPALRASVPEFLRAWLPGEHEAEPVFLAFLAFLHDASALELASDDAVLRALRSSWALCERIAAEAGHAPPSCNAMLTDGERLFALRAGSLMLHRRGLRRAPSGSMLGPARGEVGHLVALVSGVVAQTEAWPGAAPTLDPVPGDVLADWQPLPPRSVAQLSRTGAARVEPL